MYHRLDDKIYAKIMRLFTPLQLQKIIKVVKRFILSLALLHTLVILTLLKLYGVQFKHIFIMKDKDTQIGRQ